MDKKDLQIKPDLNIKIPQDIFLKDAFEVAKDYLLGAYLCSNINNQFTAGMITELEVYIGSHDKASHAYPSKRTPRTEVMFREGGCAYVTLVYGIYDQFNVVVEPEEVPSAILIRSLEPLKGIEIMQRRRKTDNILNLTNGPGKLSMAMGISHKQHHGISLISDEIWLSPKIKNYEYVESKRIGIDYAEEYADKLWRYYIKGNRFISRK